MAKKRQNSTGAENLIRQELISEADLSEARKREKASGTPWYRQLIQMKKVNFNAVTDVLNYEFHNRAKRSDHSSLGKKLLDTKRVSQAHLDEALAQQQRNGKLLGTVLVEAGYVTREVIAKTLAEQYGLDYADLGKTASARNALDAVPETMAKQKQFIPIEIVGDKLAVLISGPQSPMRLKDVGVILGLRIQSKMTAVDDIEAEIEARYGSTRAPKRQSRSASAGQTADTTTRKKTKTQPKQQVEDTETMSETNVTEPSRFEDIAREAQGVPVVKLVSTIIEGAVNSGATDVHLDPQEPEMRVRYRIDGVLHDIMSIPDDIENAVVSRLKILADVDITETRHPQDGHISMEVGGAEFDIRVATLPTYLGERIVLRLLDQSSVLAGIRDLGFEPEDEKKVSKLIEQPYGMILVTGPTGSGKTTTLYSCLNEMDVMTESIVTLEDPVEYQLSGINQVQIETDIDLSFATVLRAALRQDIDVLLVGEIRDPETARIAIRAAMTGHLVFSTLHTNDAPEAVATLRNMDIPSYLIASALTAVIAQRLVRKICDECKTSFTPTKTMLKSLKLPESTKRLYKGKGCDACYHTGAHGRTGIFEVIEVDPTIRKLIAEDEPIEKITKAAKLKTMADRCRQKVKQGIVTPEEFLRVIRT